MLNVQLKNHEGLKLEGFGDENRLNCTNNNFRMIIYVGKQIFCWLVTSSDSTSSLALQQLRSVEARIWEIVPNLKNLRILLCGRRGLFTNLQNLVHLARKEEVEGKGGGTDGVYKVL